MGRYGSARGALVDRGAKPCGPAIGLHGGPAAGGHRAGSAPAPFSLPLLDGSHRSDRLLLVAVRSVSAAAVQVSFPEMTIPTPGSLRQRCSRERRWPRAPQFTGPDPPPPRRILPEEQGHVLPSVDDDLLTPCSPCRRRSMPGGAAAAERRRSGALSQKAGGPAPARGRGAAGSRLSIERNSCAAGGAGRARRRARLVLGLLAGGNRLLLASQEQTVVTTAPSGTPLAAAPHRVLLDRPPGGSEARPRRGADLKAAGACGRSPGEQGRWRRQGAGERARSRRPGARGLRAAAAD